MAGDAVCGDGYICKPKQSPSYAAAAAIAAPHRSPKYQAPIVCAHFHSTILYGQWMLISFRQTISKCCVCNPSDWHRDHSRKRDRKLKCGRGDEGTTQRIQCPIFSRRARLWVCVRCVCGPDVRPKNSRPGPLVLCVALTSHALLEAIGVHCTICAGWMHGPKDTAFCQCVCETGMYLMAALCISPTLIILCKLKVQGTHTQFFLYCDSCCCRLCCAGCW